MRAALIRLEDIGPGGDYESAERQRKLLVVAEFLQAQSIPFQVAVIPRFRDPKLGTDRSIEQPDDPASREFVRLLHMLVYRGASLGIHGYTHQFGNSVSGVGYEFSYGGCREDCPPDDSPDALLRHDLFRRSYAYGRFRSAITAFRNAGLQPDWFETPHYAASATQRRILEACCPLLYEDNPDEPGSRRVTFRPSASPLSFGCRYVPTPLGYIAGTSVSEDLARLMNQASSYADDDLASFFFHPFLEFPYIHLREETSPAYEEVSPLHQIVRFMRRERRRFVSVRDIVGM